jgi:predicted MFS family arabinose efflux permease
MPWRAVSGAMSAVLVGIGLARFAYSPLLPVLIARGWFMPGAAAYLGAANLLGYLAGALAARHVARCFGSRPVLRGAMLLAAISLAACSVRLPFAWFFAWRLLSGITGGLLAILAPSSVLAQVPALRRGLASGLIFTGVGLGITASGTLVPLLLRWGLTDAWLGLAAISLALTLFAWHAWPPDPPAAAAAAGSDAPGRFGPVSTIYGLCAVAMVPHMVFLVDFVARGLGRGFAAGALVWILFGGGALCGPVVAGRIADGIGPATAMRGVIAAEFMAVSVLLTGAVRPVVLDGSAVLAGMIVPGISAVMLGRIGAMAGNDNTARQRGWTQATVAWAIGQAAGAYGMAWLYGLAGTYPALFVTALVALAVAGTLELVLALRGKPGLARQSGSART